MKNKKLVFSALVILSVCCILGFAYNPRFADASETIVLKINTINKNYKLGEAVPIFIEITNKSSDTVYLSSEKVDTVGIEISSLEDTEYKSYIGQEQGFIIEGVYPEIKINPNETIKRQKTILWNNGPKVSHLNADSAKRVTKGKIVTDYAIPRAGIYFIKAVLSFSGNTQHRIESEPIQITIEEPIGDDLEVWNKIKDNGDIAYFLQEGDFKIPSYKTKEREELRQEIEQIIVKHPNSFISDQIEKSLEKFQVTEEKRKAFEEKMKANRSN